MEIKLLNTEYYILFIGILLLIILVAYIRTTIISVSKERKIKLISERKAFETLLKSKEETLSIISRELHDNIGSRLFSLRLISMEDNPAFFAGCPKHVLEWNQTMSREIETIMNDVRNLSHEYAPQIQTVDNLNNALISFISRINLKNKIEFKFIIENDRLYSIDQNLALEIYRIVTELLKNIVSHSKASKAFISISTIKSDVKIEVEDNGIGFNQTKDNNEQGIGIRNIHTRVRLSGGNIKFAEKENNTGTRVVIDLPFKY